MIDSDRFVVICPYCRSHIEFNAPPGNLDQFVCPKCHQFYDSKMESLTKSEPKKRKAKKGRHPIEIGAFVNTKNTGIKQYMIIELNIKKERATCLRVVPESKRNRSQRYVMKVYADRLIVFNELEEFSYSELCHIKPRIANQDLYFILNKYKRYIARKEIIEHQEKSREGARKNNSWETLSKENGFIRVFRG